MKNICALLCLHFLKIGVTYNIIRFVYIMKRAVLRDQGIWNIVILFTFMLINAKRPVDETAISGCPAAGRMISDSRECCYDLTDRVP